MELGQVNRFAHSRFDERLRRMFSRGSVLWNVRSENKYDALREIVTEASVFGAVPELDIEDFTERVLERERMQSTGLGHGVAVAHGRTEQVTEPVVALGISREGIDFEAIDGHPVHLVFVIANHPDQQVFYLRILSKLATLGRNADFRAELLDCSCPNDVEGKMCEALSLLLPVGVSA